MKPDDVRFGGPDAFVRANSHPVAERRQHPRRDIGLCITAVPVDQTGETTGGVLVGHCLDVSDGGIKITLARSTSSRYLRIEPTAASSELGFASAVMEVLRSSRENGCYTYAGRFVNADRFVNVETGDSTDTR
jgi:hypothetical protein